MADNFSAIKKQLNTIVEEKKIYPLYQPIVSLQSGSILGYEASSGIGLENCLFTVEEMFAYAAQFHCLEELESICRKKALKQVKNSLNKKKLFLKGEQFQKKMTLDWLKRYDISPADIVFEISEQSDIEEMETFRTAVKQYEMQKYQVALNNFGKGHTGFNRIFFFQPKYVKLDISLVRNIGRDSVKSSLVEGIVEFCHRENAFVIAEGIETEEELRKLIGLGVDYGQGFYLAMPAKKLQKLQPDIKNRICEICQSGIKQENTQTFFGNVGAICQKAGTADCDTKAVTVFEYMQKNPEVTEICVVGEKGKVYGLLTKKRMDECFSGRIGYSLYSKNSVVEILDKTFLEVDRRMPIEMVARLAMIRPKKMLYDAIVVTDNGKYVGIVTVKDILEASVTIQVERAMDTNPLTHLPGNIQIQNRISENIFTQRRFSIMYLDLDNFKAYNDLYGFENGDLMLRAMAKCIEEACQNGEFIGHIGGDDFVVISNDYGLEEVFQRLIDQFQLCLKELYTPEDYAKKEICSKNRHGEREIFPLASISGALFTNEKEKVTSMNDFSYKIALTKKASKAHIGNHLEKYGETE